MRKDILLIFLLTVSIFFFTQDLQAQKIVSGGKAKASEIQGFRDAFCVDLPNNFRICKVRETVENKPLFLIRKKSETVFSTGANLSIDSTTEDFFAYQGDLDKDGNAEIIIADLVGTTNGVGISTYDVQIFRQNENRTFYKSFSFPIREFHEKGNFVFDKSRNETLILLTSWNWFETLDRKRGDGFYLVGKWFRLRNDRLQPVFDKPTLARRFLNSFAYLRGRNYDDSDAPFVWLKSRNTHKFFAEPKENAEIIETKYGNVEKFESNVFTIRMKNGETLDFPLGCCAVDSEERQKLPIKDFGFLPKNYIYPSDFDYGFSPKMVFEKIEGKKVKLEIIKAKYLKYIRLWFIE